MIRVSQNEKGGINWIVNITAREALPPIHAILLLRHFHDRTPAEAHTQNRVHGARGIDLVY